MASLRIRLPGILPAAAWRSPTVRLVCSVPPLWWRRGRPRTTHRSYAEVELLSRLAELLMPQEPIGELFRDFPVKKSQVWGSPWLRPDLTAFGVLKHAHAALFIEYDGFFRHSAVQGQAMDERKTIALLGHAPPNSYVLRIGHVTRDLSRAENAAHAVVNVWRAEHEPSLMKVVQQTGRALLCSFEHVLEREVCERLSRLVIAEAKHDFLIASSFARQAVLTRNVETKKVNMCEFLEQELRLSTARVEVLACKFPRIWGVNIDRGLRPIVAWLEDLGLSRKKVAKVFARFPQVLGCSIEGNLKPTVTWLEDVGLNRQQVAKVVAGFPQVLGCSIEDNLKPTVAWLEDVGLSRQQVAKVVAGFPQALGNSIEDNLKPTAAWLEDVGLSRRQVAKVVAGFPQVLGCSIEDNLKPTVAWLEDVGLSRQQVAKVVAGFPHVLGYSIDGNLKPKVAWLEYLGLSELQVAKVVARFPQLFGCSIDGNLKPKVAWLEDVGLNPQQVAKVVTGFPQLLGYSVQANLKPKVAWLEDVGLSHGQIAKVVACFPTLLSCSIPSNLSRKHILLERYFSKGQICSMIEYLPPLLGFSHARLSHRLNILEEHERLSELAKCMVLTDAKFAQRFPPGVGVSNCLPIRPMVTKIDAGRCYPAPKLRTQAGPPSHGKLMLWGIDELLTYHYLVSEYFMVAPADVTHDSFFKLSKQGQADLVWKGLFMDRSPISEACQGVITTLQRLGLGALLAKRDLPAIREWFAAQNLEEHVEKIFRLARVRYAVMTNIPYVEEEAQHWRQDPPKPVTSRLRTALRIDSFLKGDWMSISQALKKEGLEESLEGAQDYLRKWAKTYKPEYMMASTPHDWRYPEPAAAATMKPLVKAYAGFGASELLEK
ncbi:MTERF4, partial [Symbiodinium sp. KB8]